jgi:hypothetical protein
MLKRSSIIFFACFVYVTVLSQVTVEIDLSKDAHRVSPYLYGRNNSVSDNPSNPLSAGSWQKLVDAGVTFLRESGGNNCSKYNWRLKLSSHPDWYNNVYAHSWDFAAQSVQQNMPGAQGMWAFQLIVKAAKTSGANFNDWEYNQSQWWSGVNQNLAGGGVPNVSGGPDAQQEGNPDLYLENWTADSTVKILDHWFGDDGLGLNKNNILYWNMDNEPEIWNGTHGDIMPSQVSAENFMQSYFDVAKQARAKFPDIRLVGPVTANEWQWYNWGNGPVNAGGTNYAWLKFFIKRVAEEQEATGVRLLDVLDIHFYPSSTTVSEVVQYHRVFFDKNYIFPEANGVKTVNGGWDDSQNKEYIFQRCREWLEQYMGADHGVKFSVTEIGIPEVDPNAIAVWYASTIGEFMRQPDMEIFAPWHWYPAMWEVLHLFSRNNKSFYVSSTSSDEELVSAYPTINAGDDSLTVVLVNRSANSSKTVSLKPTGFVLGDQPFEVLKLNNLPASETFISHQTNAIDKSTVVANNNVISLTLPPLSVVSTILTGNKGDTVTEIEEAHGSSVLSVFPTLTRSGTLLKINVNATGRGTIDLLDINGKVLRNIHKGEMERSFYEEVDISGLSKGTYMIRLSIDNRIFTRKFIF